MTNPEEHGGSDGPRPRQYETAPSPREHGPGTPGDRPGSITAAFIAWTVLATFLLISGILDLANAANTTATAGRTQGPGLQPGSGLLFGGLVLFFAFKMRSGRNLARITLVVFGVLFCIFPAITLLVVTIFSPGDRPSDLVVAVAVVTAAFLTVVPIVGIVLMFDSIANAYFRASDKNR